MSERAIMKVADAKRLAEAAKRAGTVIVCEKDGVKLTFFPDIHKHELPKPVDEHEDIEL